MTEVLDPLVAVIVPTLNGARWIGEQLDALFLQETDADWHLVVVDGGSTDGTLDVVESRRPTPVPMSIIRLEGAPGVNAGLNAGIASTDSPLILIAEHDDVVAPGWMKAVLAELEVTPVVGAHMELALLNSPEVIGSRRRLPEDPKLGVPVAVATGLGLRREVWESLGGFDPTYRYGGNDIDFCFRAHQAGYEVALADAALVHYRVRPDPSAAFRQARSYGGSSVRLYMEHGPAYLRRRTARQVCREISRLGWWAVRSITDPSYRMRLAFRGGLQLGYLEGSVKYRRWFP